MKMLLAVLLNAALLALVLPWLWKQWQWAAAMGWRWVFAMGLGLRIVAGVAQSLPLRLDAAYMSGVSVAITRLLWKSPAEHIHIIIQPVTVFTAKSGGMVFQYTSNTWMLIKLLALLNLFSVSSGLLNALYLSLFVFAGCWSLARTLVDCFPGTPAGAGSG